MILDLDRDVMEAWAALREKFLEPLVAFRRDELERRLTVADRQECCVGVLRRHDFAHGRFQAERALPGGLGRVHVGDANRHVIDAFDADHGWSLVMVERALGRGERTR